MKEKRGALLGRLDGKAKKSGTLACMLMLVALTGCVGTRFTFDQVREVKLGMSESQVQAIMGKPIEIRADSTNYVWIYRYTAMHALSTDSRWASFVFTDGKVTSVPVVPSSIDKAAAPVTVQSFLPP